MERWWTTKYRLPSNHKLFQKTTYFELLVDYFQDYYEANPIEQYRNEQGNIQFKDTGDPLIDKWEQEIQEGNTPDLLEAFSEEQKRSIIEKLERARGSAHVNYLRHLHGNT